MSPFQRPTVLGSTISWGKFFLEILACLIMGLGSSFCQISGCLFQACFSALNGVQAPPQGVWSQSDPLTLLCQEHFSPSWIILPACCQLPLSVSPSWDPYCVHSRGEDQRAEALWFPPFPAFLPEHVSRLWALLSTLIWDKTSTGWLALSTSTYRLLPSAVVYVCSYSLSLLPNEKSPFGGLFCLSHLTCPEQNSWLSPSNAKKNK